ANWGKGWYFGVGGAGFHDGLFIIPLETLALSWSMLYLGDFLRRRGFLDRRVAPAESEFSGEERRTHR
ncbi:MAG: hypothetical protein OWQ56_09660, partial [Acidithiobacillus caldus]|nr:hypothetical protein [Acidithiobacillus caldus]